MTETNAHAPETPPVGVVRCAATGVLMLAAAFALCWAASALSVLLAPLMFVALFTTATEASVAALGVGLCAALAFEALTARRPTTCFASLRPAETGVPRVRT
jgi:hypothetical protein